MDRFAAMTTFVAVVEAGSFTRAADVLALPRARVSQRVADLERHLGVRLLYRTTRALSLTEDGHAYFARCQTLLQDIEALEETVRKGSSALRGRLRVEALVSVARWVIAPRLHEFHARHPGVVVRLGASDRIGHLLEDGIDCVIRGGPLEDSRLVARHVCDVRLGLYAAPDYLGTAGAVRHPRDLAGHRRLSWFSGLQSPFAWRIETTTVAFELPATDGLLFDDPDVAVAACMAGGGICPGAPFAVEQWVRAGALVPVLPHWHFPARPIHLLYPDSRRVSARVRCFVDWSLDLMRTHPGLRMGPLELAGALLPGENAG